mgnify:FL=1
MTTVALLCELCQCELMARVEMTDFLYRVVDVIGERNVTGEKGDRAKAGHQRGRDDDLGCDLLIEMPLDEIKYRDRVLSTREQLLDDMPTCRRPGDDERFDALVAPWNLPRNPHPPTTR